jgi:hypothetical protein
LVAARGCVPPRGGEISTNNKFDFKNKDYVFEAYTGKETDKKTFQLFIFSGKPASVDFSTPAAMNFKMRFAEGTAKDPNFAGHYMVVTWGCGTNYVAVSLVDAKTGAVHMLAGVNPWVKLEYRLDSFLIVENGDEELGKRLVAEKSAALFDTNYAVWRDDRLDLIYSRNYSEEAE